MIKVTIHSSPPGMRTRRTGMCSSPAADAAKAAYAGGVSVSQVSSGYANNPLHASMTALFAYPDGL